MIAKVANLWYDLGMKTYFDETLTYNRISFCYAKKESIDEREIHPYHEILYYLDGGATILTEHYQEKLEKGTLLFIPKESYHYFQLTEPEQFTRLKISFPDFAELGSLLKPLMHRITIMKHANSLIRHTLDQMCQMLLNEKASDRTQVFLYGAFWMLLAEISAEHEKSTTPDHREKGHLISRTIQYIDRHLTEEIPVSAIADRMNVSASTLSHSFKKELGISLHQYVMEKRLIYARKRLTENGSPTKIYMECGYSDYSSFYKAYLKMFGVPPSEDKQ